MGRIPEWNIKIITILKILKKNELKSKSPTLIVNNYGFRVRYTSRIDSMVFFLIFIS